MLLTEAENTTWHNLTPVISVVQEVTEQFR